MNNTTAHYRGTRRATETAGPSGDCTVEVIGDQDADGRVTSASICLAGEVLLSADEALQIARHLIAAVDELSEIAIVPV
ncbi:MAG: hypothetical protein WBV80_10205 [Mycobacterium sp.]